MPVLATTKCRGTPTRVSDMIRPHRQSFILDYFDKYWPDMLQIDQNNANLSMESFLKIVTFILDVDAPLKKVNEYELKFKTKP